jgi:hypothetical protein
MENKQDSPKITGIVKALGEFQSICPAIKKEKTAGTGKFQYKYGSLPHILEAIRPHMKKAELAFTQPIVTRDEKQFIVTTLFHTKTGESIESDMELPEIKFQGMNELQSKGSAITYLRRYGLMSILGLVTEEDDNDAAGKTEKPAAKPPASKPAANEPTTKAATLPYLNPEPKEKWLQAVKYLADGGAIGEIKKKYRLSKVNEERLLSESLNFDDLPFDRQAADAADKADGAAPDQPNLGFDSQGETPAE